MHIYSVYRKIKNAKNGVMFLCGPLKSIKALTTVVKNEETDSYEMDAKSVVDIALMVCQNDDEAKMNMGLSLCARLYSSYNYLFVRNVEALYGKEACVSIFKSFLEKSAKTTKVIIVTEEYSKHLEALGVREENLMAIEAFSPASYYVTKDNNSKKIEICSDSNDAVLAFISENGCITHEEYQKYFLPIKSGDSFVVAKDFKQAEAEYKNALAYAEEKGKPVMEMIAIFRFSVCEFFEKGQTPKAFERWYSAVGRAEKDGGEYNIHKSFIKAIHLGKLGFSGYSLMLGEDSI